MHQLVQWRGAARGSSVCVWCAELPTCDIIFAWRQHFLHTAIFTARPRSREIDRPTRVIEASRAAYEDDFNGIIDVTDGGVSLLILISKYHAQLARTVPTEQYRSHRQGVWCVLLNTWVQKRGHLSNARAGVTSLPVRPRCHKASDLLRLEIERIGGGE